MEERRARRRRRRRIALDDVDVGLARRHVHARHLEIVEVALLGPTCAEGDLAVRAPS
jgi:hypothetical protein